MSSISNTSPEEDAAFCLMLLSRDTWSDMHDIKSKNSTRSKFRCETCDKVFKSYKALGGHKEVTEMKSWNHGENDHKTKIVLSGDIKVHECDVCFKVFGSGQALGGHKRSHVNVGKPKINLIDLNLPTPIDEDTNYNDDDAGSQFEASVVSDGEFVN
ncbi:zinc finger protein ZAT9-like protein [Tanacetum coccineum]